MRSRPLRFLRLPTARTLTLAVSVAALSAAVTAAVVLPKVPSLKGESVMRAESMLRDAFMRMELPSRDEVTLDDEVVGQSPPARFPARAGTAVVVRTRPSSGQSRVPDVVGSSLGEASLALSSEGLFCRDPTGKRVSLFYEDRGIPLMVVDQSPKPGVRVPKHTDVRVKLAWAPAE